LGGKVSSYLFIRVLKRGHDSRFEKTVRNPRRFFAFWMAQAVWVLLCSAPVIALDAVHPAAFKAGMGVPSVLRTDVVGLGLFAVGWIIEVVADWQKWIWYLERERKVHDERFITRGLWGRR
jgi:steroid 5-alpha reductase family enzyme